MITLAKREGGGRGETNLEAGRVTSFQAFAVVDGSDDCRVANESDDRDNG